jgi:hypothetical protein
VAHSQTQPLIALFSIVNSVAVCPGVNEYKGVNKAMSTNSGSLTEVLHSDKHSKLTAEEVAKAVARHNKNHSAAKAENAAAKAAKAPKK